MSMRLRRYIVALLCAGCVMFVTPRAAGPEPRDRPEAVAALTVPHGGVPQMPMSDEVRIILVGSVLIGVAALVRRTA